MRGAAGLAAATLLAAASEAFAAETAGFLRLQPGARAAAMGEALVASADDLNAFTVNPAGLALAEKRQAGFSHAELFEDSRLDHAAYLHPFEENGTAGVSFLRLSHGKLEGRDASGARAGTFEAADMALSLAFARKAAEGLVAGAAVKYIDSKIADTHARGAAADLGAVWTRGDVPLPFSLGAAALHLGPGLKRDREREALPATLSVGAAARPMNGALAALDLRYRPNASGTELSFGGEYALVEALRLRAGYALRPGKGPGGASGLGAGFGVTLSGLTVDYAFSPYGELGHGQRVSVSLRF